MQGNDVFDKVAEIFGLSSKQKKLHASVPQCFCLFVCLDLGANQIGFGIF